jgi:hypothetical protein
MAIRDLNSIEILLVSGGDAVDTGLVCAGSLIAIAASEGTLLLAGAGLVALGACKQFVDAIDPPSPTSPPNRQSVSGVIIDRDTNYSHEGRNSAGTASASLGGLDKTIYREIKLDEM